jgi:hypothetical protein
MATRLYSATVSGALDVDITEAVGSAIVTTPIELTVDLASVPDKQTVLRALEKLTTYITEGMWPPV